MKFYKNQIVNQKAHLPGFPSRALGTVKRVSEISEETLVEWPGGMLLWENTSSLQLDYKQEPNFIMADLLGLTI